MREDVTTEAEIKAVWPGSKKCRWHLEARKGKELDSPLELPKGTNPVSTLILVK